MIDDTFRKVMNVDRDIADTSLAQQIERVGEKRAAQDGEHRFRPRASKRLQPRAKPGCQNHRFH